MNHDDHLTTPPPGDTDDRVPEVLGRGGVVEHAPPPHVWEAIVRSLSGARSLGVVRNDRADRGDQGDLRPLRTGARRRTRWAAIPILAAAAVGAVLTWAGMGLVDREAPGELLVGGELAALSEGGTDGRAEIVEVAGQQHLRIALADRPDAGDGYLEVWLLRPDVSGMVTLGVLQGDSGEFLLPAGLDVGEYAVVDISREHLDGDPRHGGDSLVRGEIG